VRRPRASPSGGAADRRRARLSEGVHGGFDVYLSFIGDISNISIVNGVYKPIYVRIKGDISIVYR
jgi:hypothetical protein